MQSAENSWGVFKALFLMALLSAPWVSVHAPGPLPPQRAPGEPQPAHVYPALGGS